MKEFNIDTLVQKVPNRLVNSHKGDYGKVLIIAGTKGMGGAGILSSEACVFCGAGLVTLVTHPENCLLYTSPSPRDRTRSRMPSSA